MERYEVESVLSSALVSVSVVALILGIKRLQVYKLIEAGKLEAVNVGAGQQRPRYRIKSDSVRNLMGE